MRPSIRLSCLTALALVLGGTQVLPAYAKPEEPAATSDPVFFPPPPEAPRLQFLASFSDDSILQDKEKKKKKFNFAAWVTGAKEEGAGASKIDNPYGVAVRDGKVYVCDLAGKTVHIFDFRQKTSGKLSGKFGNPVNLTIAADGTRYLCDTGLRAILVYDRDDKYQFSIQGPSDWTPIDVVESDGKLYVADVTGGKIHVLARDGAAISTIGTKGMGPEELGNPTNLDMGPDGKLYVTDTLGQAVKVFDRNGKMVGVIGGPGAVVGRFARPKGIAIDPAGQIYVADTQWSVVQIFRNDGRVLLPFGRTENQPAAAVTMPATVVVDTSSLEDFRSFLAPNFKPEHLVFVVNQFGKFKVLVYAYGRDTRLPASRYEIDMQKVAEAEAKVKAAAAAEAAEKAKEQPGSAAP